MFRFILKLYRKYKYRNKLKRLNTTDRLMDFYLTRINQLRK